MSSGLALFIIVYHKYWMCFRMLNMINHEETGVDMLILWFIILLSPMGNTCILRLKMCCDVFCSGVSSMFFLQHEVNTIIWLCLKLVQL